MSSEDKKPGYNFEKPDIQADLTAFLDIAGEPECDVSSLVLPHFKNGEGSFTRFRLPDDEHPAAMLTVDRDLQGGYTTRPANILEARAVQLASQKHFPNDSITHEIDAFVERQRSEVENLPADFFAPPPQEPN